jgi:5-methylcytosine-specific restriction endonuclease McrA
LYASWADFTTRADPWQVRSWCGEKAKKANSRAAQRGITVTIDGADVFAILLAAHGRCVYCGSLAVETIPGGKFVPWYWIGRRVGNIDHVQPLGRGGTNKRANLAWACMLCNSGAPERIPGANDRGAVHCIRPDDAPPCEGPVVKGIFTFTCGWCA